MSPTAFKTKWQRFSGKETAAYQEHFNDLCRLLRLPTPAEADPTGNDTFCFKKYVLKDAKLFSLSPAGETANDPEERGFADVWKAGCFAWEYKGKRANLDAAYKQLLNARLCPRAAFSRRRYFASPRTWRVMPTVIKHRWGDDSARTAFSASSSA